MHKRSAKMYIFFFKNVNKKCRLEAISRKFFENFRVYFVTGENFGRFFLKINVKSIPDYFSFFVKFQKKHAIGNRA